MLQLHIFIVRASLVSLSALALACGGDPAGGRRPAGTGGVGEAGGGPSGQGGLSGASGAGGAVIAGAGGAAASSGASGASGAGGTDDGLTVHIEDSEQLAVEIVTVSCPGECVEVKAVARGGQPAYHFEWEDGSTGETRTLCPEESSTHEVTVTDTGREGEEFGRAMQTAKASVDVRVLQCPVEEPPASPDAGAGDECADDSDCGAGQTCFEGICVGEGGLRFSLTWNVDTDFDLFVRMPDGRTEISYIFDNAGGGMLDVDDCFEGCRIPGGPHVENIFFEGEPPRGTYTYWVVNSGLVDPDDFRLEVSAAGMVQAMQTGTLAAFDPESDRYTFEY